MLRIANKTIVHVLIRLAAFGLVLWSAPAADAVVVVTDATPVPDDLLGFVNQLYIHGLPVADATTQFDTSHVPALLQLVDDPNEAPYVHNIVLMLGLVGDHRATARLTAFIDEAPPGVTPFPRFLALATVPHALGFLAERGDPDALAFLIEHAEPAAWNKVAGNWIIPGQDPGDFRHFMTKNVIFGLSVAAKPRAEAVLNQLNAQVNSKTLPGHYANNLREGLDRLGRIKAKGVDKVFKLAGKPPDHRAKTLRLRKIQE